MNAKRVTFAFLVFLPILVNSQKCESKVFMYRQYTVCNNIRDKFPSDISAIRSLQCVKCDIPTFNDDTLKNFRGDMFNVSNSNIKTLEESAFKSFWPTVKSFYLNDNKISKLPQNIFKRFSGLRILNLSGNKITQLERNIFDNVTTQTLDLSRNNISEIIGIFDGLRINSLNLSFNNIQEVPVDAFVYTRLNTVEYTIEEEFVSLQNNSISKIYSGSFTFKGKLKGLNLRSNLLEEINNKTFLNLTSLRNLYLSENRIRVIERGAFHDLIMLNTLDLGNNLLDYIPFGLFKDLSKLKTLILSNNRLSDLQSTTFSGLLTLMKLDLSGNKLKVLDDSTLFPMGQLATLEIKGNRIQDFELDTILSHHNRLKNLNINDNFWLCKSLVNMYKLMNQKLGGFVTPSTHFHVPNLHGIACSRVLFEVDDDMTFDDFLKFISQDMVLEDLYDVKATDIDSNLSSQTVSYLRDMFYMQLIITTIIVVAVCVLLCLCVSSYFQKNKFTQHLKLFYNSRGDNVELLK